MIRRPPRSTLDRSSAASDVYKRQYLSRRSRILKSFFISRSRFWCLSLIHISEPTRQAEISYAVFCLKKKTQQRAPLEPPVPEFSRRQSPWHSHRAAVAPV